MGITCKTLVEDWAENPRSAKHLKAWYAEAASWTTPTDVKAKCGSASILKDGRGFFNICGNEFRSVVLINNDIFTIHIRFIKTHAEYDKMQFPSSNSPAEPDEPEANAMALTA